jgi:hypothetical protein
MRIRMRTAAGPFPVEFERQNRPNIVGTGPLAKR